ncbi:MAG: VOC family protein [Anaerolineales bacterium]|nr:VOC family protein [Anaerolineales bacterium]
MAQAIETTPIRDKWGARVFYCFDPEGHRIEF